MMREGQIRRNIQRLLEGGSENEDDLGLERKRRTVIIPVAGGASGVNGRVGRD